MTTQSVVSSEKKNNKCGVIICGENSASSRDQYLTNLQNYKFSSKSEKWFYSYRVTASQTDRQRQTTRQTIIVEFKFMNNKQMKKKKREDEKPEILQQQKNPGASEACM